MKLVLWDMSYAVAAFSFSVNPDSCMNPDYFQSFIRFSAITDHISGRGVTHALLNDDESSLLGFVTLKNTALLTGRTLGEPALEIVNLAVAHDHERQGVGSALVNFAISTAAQISESLSGVRFLVLGSDPRAVDFYTHLGFHPLDEYWTLPRELTNKTCVPMFMQLRV